MQVFLHLNTVGLKLVQSPEGEREQEKGRKKRGEGEENERRK